MANGRWVDARQHTEAWLVKNGVLARPWTIDAYSIISVGFGAQFNLGQTKCNASVMVKNALDEQYLATRNYYGAPRTVEFTLRASF